MIKQPVEGVVVCICKLRSSYGKRIVYIIFEEIKRRETEGKRERNGEREREREKRREGEGGRCVVVVVVDTIHFISFGSVCLRRAIT